MDDWAMILAYVRPSKISKHVNGTDIRQLCFVVTCAITLIVSKEINGIFKGKPIHVNFLNKVSRAAHRDNAFACSC